MAQARYQIVLSSFSVPLTSNKETEENNPKAPITQLDLPVAFTL